MLFDIYCVIYDTESIHLMKDGIVSGVNCIFSIDIATSNILQYTLSTGRLAHRIEITCHMCTKTSVTILIVGISNCSRRMVLGDTQSIEIVFNGNVGIFYFNTGHLIEILKYLLLHNTQRVFLDLV